MDRFSSMEAFVAVVEAGSLTAAAERLGISAAMVGKHLRALERRLGASLLTRSTRRQSLTEPGRDYFQRCREILEALRLADASAEAQQQVPRGRLRVSAPVTLGSLCLAPALVDFLAEQAQVQVELDLSDRAVDLVEDGFDAALRIGPLPDLAALVARPLPPYAMMICAAPDYLARAGTPQQPPDLAGHHCLGFSPWKQRDGWQLGRPHVAPDLLPQSRLDCNHGPALRLAALRGLGLVLQPRLLLEGDVRAGRLVELMPEALPPPLPVHLIHLRRAAAMPPRLRSFLDFVGARFGQGYRLPAQAWPGG